MNRHPPIEIDVRRLPVHERHPRIIAAFDALVTGTELRIISDHEPRPLRTEFERTRQGSYVWLQRLLGADRWEVTLRRIRADTVGGRAAFLKRCALLADAAPETIVDLERVATTKTYAHGEAVAEQDLEWGFFGIVEHGTVAAVVASPFGREHALYEVVSGEPFGEIAVIGGGTVPVRFVVASSTARILCIPKTSMRVALSSDPALTSAMTDLCAQRLRIVIHRFAAQTSLPTIARVAAALLPHASPERGLQPVLPSFQSMTQVELATAAGTVKEVVSRALAELEAAGALERKAGHIVKLDRQKLTHYPR